MRCRLRKDAAAAQPSGHARMQGGTRRHTSKSSALKNSSWPCMAFRPPSTRKRPWGDHTAQLTALLGCELISCTPCAQTGEVSGQAWGAFQTGQGSMEGISS